MTASFVIYIDESGDEGFRFKDGSSEWFVLSAVITRKTEDLEVVKLVDRVRATLRKDPQYELHFRDLRHEQRLAYINEISQAHLRVVSILMHKPSIYEQEVFQQRYRLYFYAVRYLLERASWYCRDHPYDQDVHDGSAEIIFSNRAGMSYDELRQYLNLLKTQSAIGAKDIRIEWSVVKAEQIKAYPARARMGLQIADAVASSFYFSVQPRLALSKVVMFLCSNQLFTVERANTEGMA